jgi:hypothetical protein
MLLAGAAAGAIVRSTLATTENHFDDLDSTGHSTDHMAVLKGRKPTGRAKECQHKVIVSCCRLRTVFILGEDDVWVSFVFGAMRFVADLWSCYTRSLMRFGCRWRRQLHVQGAEIIYLVGDHWP